MNVNFIDGALARLKVVPGAEAERLRKTEFEDPKSPKLRSLYRDAGLPLRHSSTESDFSGSEWVKTADGLKKRLGSGFLCALIGTRGSGKTQLGVELAKTVILAGKSARFTSATRFLMDIKATYRKDATETESGVLASYTRPALLVIDELGRRGETDWEDRLLFELLNDRYNAVKDTVLISNHETVEKFGEAVGPSLVSRINETGGVRVCNWPSFREKKS